MCPTGRISEIVLLLDFEIDMGHSSFQTERPHPLVSMLLSSVHLLSDAVNLKASVIGKR